MDRPLFLDQEGNHVIPAGSERKRKNASTGAGGPVRRRGHEIPMNVTGGGQNFPPLGTCFPPSECLPGFVPVRAKRGVGELRDRRKRFRGRTPPGVLEGVRG
jgi:hypothetical protein